MRLQNEILYAILFLSLIISVVVLVFFALTLSYKQNEVFIRYTSVNTLVNYFLGYMSTLIQQQAYTQSYNAGTNSWNQSYWASVPYGCHMPPECPDAMSFYNKLLMEGIMEESNIGMLNLYQEKYYYPFNVNLNFSDQYIAGIIGSCQNVNSGEYDYWFPIGVNGIYINVTSPNTGAIYPYLYSFNVTNNPAFYLYRNAYDFSLSGEFSDCSYVDCVNTLLGSPTYTCKDSFENFVGNPAVKCNESIIPYQCKVPLNCDKYCWYPIGIACIITLSCEHTDYNVYYNGVTLPQRITFSSIVYYQNVTQYAYKICEYKCEYKVNKTTGKPITPLPLTCKLNNQWEDCDPLDGCGSSSVVSEDTDTKTIEFLYYVSYRRDCIICWINVRCECNPDCAKDIQCPDTMEVNTYCST
ncbi:MAG: hypothetical protein ACP5G1_01175 [Nanopusillaceae archaeon]